MSFPVKPVAPKTVSWVMVLSVVFGLQLSVFGKKIADSEL
jgi:hypothetical protein